MPATEDVTVETEARSRRIDDDELRFTSLKRRLERAQGLVQKHVKPGTSLVG